MIGWPTTPEAGTVRESLRDAGIAYLDVSPAQEGEGSGARDGRLRLVADDDSQADALSGAVREAGDPGDRVCLGNDEDPRDISMIRQVSTSLRTHHRHAVSLAVMAPGLDAYPESAAEIEAAACSAVVFAGSGTDAAVLRSSMDSDGLGQVALFGPDVVRNEAFLKDAGAAADGTVTVCSCVLVPDDGDLATGPPELP